MYFDGPEIAWLERRVSEALWTPPSGKARTVKKPKVSARETKEVRLVQAARRHKGDGAAIDQPCLRCQGSLIYSFTGPLQQHTVWCRDCYMSWPAADPGWRAQPINGPMPPVECSTCEWHLERYHAQLGYGFCANCGIWRTAKSAPEATFEARRAAAKARIPDWDHVFSGPISHEILPPTIAAFVASQPLGPEVLYYLAKYQHEFYRIRGLTKHEQTKALLSLHASAAAGTLLTAPKNYQPVSSPPSPEPDYFKSAADYNAWRAAQISSRGRKVTLPYVHQEYPRMLYPPGGKAKRGDPVVVENAHDHRQYLARGYTETPG